MGTVRPQHTGLPWLTIGGGAAVLLLALALLIVTVVHGWRKRERLHVSTARHEPQ